MFYGAPSALGVFNGFFQHNSNATWGNLVVLATNKAAGHVSFATIGGQMQDVNRINYFTPRFMGLQIGVGYAPKINAAGSIPGSNTAGVCGFNDATAQINCPTNDFSWQDFFDVGANYLNKFGDITVAAFGAFMYANFVPGFTANTGAANIVTGSNLTSWKQWVVGLQFGYAGFTVGGSYGRNTNGNGSASLVNITNTQVAVVGGAATSQAAFGGNPNIGGLQFGQESADKFEVGANYALGPGIKVLGGVQYYNFAGPSNAVAAQSWAILLGMDLRF